MCGDPFSAVSEYLLVSTGPPKAGGRTLVCGQAVRQRLVARCKRPWQRCGGGVGGGFVPTATMDAFLSLEVGAALQNILRWESLPEDSIKEDTLHAVLPWANAASTALMIVLHMSRRSLMSTQALTICEIPGRPTGRTTAASRRHAWFHAQRGPRGRQEVGSLRLVRTG